jgi:Ni/Co efflux regulator RcnB
MSLLSSMSIPRPTTARTLAIRIGLCTSLALSALAAAPLAHAAAAKKESSADSSASRTAKKKKTSVKIKHHRSASEESPQERDKRLSRECKGAPNAGGCLGYAKP